MKTKDPTQVVLFFLDLLAISISWQLAVQVRIAMNPFMQVHFNRATPDLWAPSLVSILFLWIVTALWLRLYSTLVTEKLRHLIRRAVEAAVILCCITVVVTFFSRGIGSGVSRTFVVIFAPLSFLLFSLTRTASPFTGAYFHRRWPLMDRVAVVGQMEPAMRLLKTLEHKCGMMRIRGLIVPRESETPSDAHAFQILGKTDRLAELINRERLNRLIIIDRSMSESELEACSKVSRRMGISVSCAVAYEPVYERAQFTTIRGVALVELTPVSFSLWQEFIKRALDLALAAGLLVLSAPAMLAIAVLIKLTSKGPVLYKAPRVGKGGRYFTFLKFRSMYIDSDRPRSSLRNEKDGHIFKVRNDPRITPLGRFIRRYSLDELPQLLNVLRGEMSIVGPRPLPAQDLDPDGMSGRFGLWAEQRSRVHPGITGLWQVRGRSALAFEDMIRFDLEYIQNWSLLTDMQILLETPALVLGGVGAY
jgi:exopolysaccharide biosynthesis polyprenyl glycosylphosphotransferase